MLSYKFASKDASDENENLYGNKSKNKINKLKYDQHEE
jgi:hypothetical protein